MVARCVLHDARDLAHTHTHTHAHTQQHTHTATHTHTHVVFLAVLQTPPHVTRRRLLIVLLVLANLPLALYTSLLHQRGVVDVTRHVGDVASRRQGDEQPMSVLYLMPCHSTPYYA